MLSCWPLSETSGRLVCRRCGLIHGESRGGTNSAVSSIYKPALTFLEISPNGAWCALCSDQRRPVCSAEWGRALPWRERESPLASRHPLPARPPSTRRAGGMSLDARGLPPPGTVGRSWSWSWDPAPRVSVPPPGTVGRSWSWSWDPAPRVSGAHRSPQPAGHRRSSLRWPPQSLAP